MIYWERHIGRIVEILETARPATPLSDLLARISLELGTEVSRNSLHHALTRAGFPTAIEIIGRSWRRPVDDDLETPIDGLLHRRRDETPPPPQRAQTEPAPPPPPGATRPDFARLMRAVGRGIEFESLCDMLRLCPSDCRQLIADARKAGYSVDVAGNVVARREEQLDDMTQIEISSVSNRTRFAVIGDTHFGSRFCMRAQILDFWDRLREMGVSHVLHAGDLVEGLDAKVRWELSHHDIYSQLDDALAHIPDDIRLDGITGNHDAWLGTGTGLHVPTAFNDFFHSRGRPLVCFHSSMNHTLLLNGMLRVRLKHPAGGKPYARSYKGQVEVRELPSATATKPHIWCFGHRHGYVHFFERGIHCIDVPCWVGSGSDFSKRLHGAPTIGGIVLDVGQIDNGLVRDLSIKPITYYEAEHVTRVA